MTEETILKWRPIETAPKDGTKIIVCRPVPFKTGVYIVEMARWQDDRYAAKPRPFWVSCEDFRVGSAREMIPYCWMPCPEPPMVVMLKWALEDPKE